MNKREPLLSDEAITDRAKSSYNFDLAWAAIDYGRTFYERLIDEGKLRVVQEVENVARNRPIAFVCSGCGSSPGSVGRLSKTGFPYVDPFEFCPGCGNKIKR